MIQIIAIRKPENTAHHHSAISHYKWKGQDNKIDYAERMVVVNWMLENPTQHRAFVVGINGSTAYCKVVENIYGTKFLETYADNTGADNLLSLPRF